MRSPLGGLRKGQREPANVVPVGHEPDGTGAAEARGPGVRWPTLNQLTPAQHEQVDGTLNGTLVALSDVPGTLETTQLPKIPRLTPSQGAVGSPGG